MVPSVSTKKYVGRGETGWVMLGGQLNYPQSIVNRFGILYNYSKYKKHVGQETFIRKKSIRFVQSYRELFIYTLRPL
jgi:hypothetical protein